MFERVIVPLDGSQISAQALSYGVDLAQRFGARLLLLRAVDGDEQVARNLAMIGPGVGSGAMLVDPVTVDTLTGAARDQKAEARDYLDQQVRSLGDRGIAVEPVLHEGQAADVITQEAHREPNTVVVIASHGRGGVARSLFGSTTNDVLAKCHAPVLLVRVAGAVSTSGGADVSGDIQAGADVLGRDGKLGTVSRVMLSPHTRQIEGVVVKHGFLFTGERVVAPAQFSHVEGGAVIVDLDEAQFEQLPGYDERLAGAGATQEANERSVTTPDNLHLTSDGGQTITERATATRSVDRSLAPVLTRGMEVVSADGEKVGEIGDFSVSADTGAATRITVKRGMIFKDETELPLEWIADVRDQTVVLRVPKAELETLIATSR